MEALRAATDEEALYLLVREVPGIDATWFQVSKMPSWIYTFWQNLACINQMCFGW